MNSFHDKGLRFYTLCNSVCNSCVIVPRKAGNFPENASIQQYDESQKFPAILKNSEQKRSSRKTGLIYLKSLGTCDCASSILAPHQKFQGVTAFQL